VILTTPSKEDITNIINTQIADRLQVIVAEEVGSLERSLCGQLNATFELLEKEKEQ
jgi:S-ribosylhomocysteine lyase LuxS involved in autoinducer biosynthesis